MSYRHAKKPASLSAQQQARLLQLIRALLVYEAKQRKLRASSPKAPPPGPDVGKSILTGAVKEGLSFIPVVGPALGALAGPIVNGISDWFSAGEAGEKFFHETYLPKAATPLTPTAAKDLTARVRKIALSGSIGGKVL